MEGDIEKGKIAAEPVQDEIVKTLNSKREYLIEQIHGIEQEISGITETYKQRINELSNQKQPLEEALVHVDALLRLEGGNNQEPGYAETILTLPSESSVRLTDIAYKILEENGKPIHYRDLATRIKEKDIVIPGKDAAATLLSRISRDRRFRRTKKRGVYAIKTWSVKDVTAKRRRNKKRR